MSEKEEHDDAATGTGTGTGTDEISEEGKDGSFTEHWKAGNPAVAGPEGDEGDGGEADDVHEAEVEEVEVSEVDASNASGSAEDDLKDLLQKFQEALRIGTPTVVRKPILSSFDVEGVAEYIKSGKAKNVVCLCGAGISVSAGIPDFRSPKTGLYSRLAEMGLGRPEDVFSINFFRNDPKPFYEFSKEIVPGKFKPTPAHYFMALLEKKEILLRCYTQNIDSLERIAGVSQDLVVPAHGNFDGAHCIDCQRAIPTSDIQQNLLEGTVAFCPFCRGYVKPDIVFFGESLPARFFTLAKTDFPICDLLIVMGSSLVVYPFAALVGQVDDDIPRLLINREVVGDLEFGGGNYRDALFQGDCDDGVRALAEHLGWQSDLEELIAAVPLGQE